MATSMSANATNTSNTTNNMTTENVATEEQKALATDLLQFDADTVSVGEDEEDFYAQSMDENGNIVIKQDLDYKSVVTADDITAFVESRNTDNDATNDVLESEVTDAFNAACVGKDGTAMAKSGSGGAGCGCG